MLTGNQRETDWPMDLNTLISQYGYAALAIDQAQKLCKLSLEIDKRIRAGDKDVDKFLSSYDKIVKTADFTPKSVKNATDFDSIGELMFWLEKRGHQNKFYDNTTRDVIDETLKNIEAWNQRNMEYAINEVIGPLMLDIPNSTILCLGTPPRIPKTYGERVWKTEKGWKKFHWTAEENPYIPNYEEFIEELCKNKGITRDAPFIQREYYGVIGAYDTEASVFKDYKTYNADEPLDFVPEKVYIGIDIGFEDNNSIIALAASNEKARVIFERKFNRASISEIIKQVQEVYSDSKKFLIENNKNANISDVNIYCDMNNKELVYELYSVQKLPAYCAYKYNKEMAISQLSEFCRTGKIVVPQDGFLADEFDRTLYKRDEEDNILSVIDDELFHPDAVFALLYAVRQYWFDTGKPYGGESSEDWQ